MRFSATDIQERSDDNRALRAAHPPPISRSSSSAHAAIGNRSPSIPQHLPALGLDVVLPPLLQPGLVALGANARVVLDEHDGPLPFAGGASAGELADPLTAPRARREAALRSTLAAPPHAASCWAASANSRPRM